MTLEVALLVIILQWHVIRCIISRGIKQILNKICLGKELASFRMDPGKIFQIITNSTLLATRLLSGTGRSVLEFTQHRYCAVLREDTPTSSDVITVVATHKEGASVRYSITGGNRDGLFTIDQHTGLITLAASLDYELYDKHELVVSGEGGGQVVHTIVQVAVADVNDNPPVFTNPDPHVTVIEEDDRHLPTTLIKISATDPDQSDEAGLLYTLRGDGVDGHSPDDAYFSIKPRTGDLIQLRALDRDPPNGKRIWKLRVKVQDGQEPWHNQNTYDDSNSRPWSPQDRGPSWDYEQAFLNDAPATWQSKEEVEERHRKKSKVQNLDMYKVRTPSYDHSNIRLVDGRQNPWSKSSIENGDLIPSRSTREYARKAAWNHEGLYRYKGRPSNRGYREDSIYESKGNSWKFSEVSEMEGKQTTWDDNDGSKRVTGQSVWSSMPLGDQRDTLELSRRVSEERLRDTQWSEITEERSKKHKSVVEKSHKPTSGEGYFGLTQKDGYFGIPIKVTNTKRNYQSSRESQWHMTKTIDIADIDKVKERRFPHPEDSSSNREKMESGLEGRFIHSRTKSRRLTEASRPLSNRKRNGLDRDQERKRVMEGNNSEATVADSHSLDNLIDKRYVVIGADGSRILVKGNVQDYIYDYKGIAFSSARKKDNQDQSKHVGYNTKVKICDDSCRKKHEMNDYIISGTPTPVEKDNYRDWNGKRSKNVKQNDMIDSRSSDTYGYDSPDYLISLDDSKQPKISRNINWRSRPFLWNGANSADDIPGRMNQLRTRKSKRSTSNKSELTISEEELSNTHHSKETINIEDSFPNQGLRKLDELLTSKRPFRTKVTFVNKTSLSNHFQSTGDISLLEDVSVSGNERLNISSPLEQKSLPLVPVSRDSTSKTLNVIGSGPSPSVIKNLFLGKFPDMRYSRSTNISGKSILSDPKTGHAKGQTIHSTGNRHTKTAEKKVNNRLSKITINRNLLPKGTGSRDLFARATKDRDWSSRIPRDREWSSRIPRNIDTDEPFDNFDMEEEECHDATETTGHVGGAAFRRDGEPVHEAEIMVTVIVKDINDNAPVFPNVTMFGEVQENGPVALSVAEVSAWDADDSTEGTNARITYSIEKNVIHDKSGEAIFNVHPQSGLVTTALCCLDRETTPEYNIQVVAADGGGLKGTGTVVVRLTDENDNSPRLARQYWELEVDETRGDGPLDNATLLEMTAADPDTQNYFSYRVVEESGWGWDHFGIRSAGASGQLYAIRKLDYEDDTHRQGFKFMVQVTDRGESGWVDPRHQDTAWVGVRLRDLNDNPPQFPRPHAHVTVSEDAEPGTLLITMAAHDPDMGGAGKVDYQVVGGWNSLKVDDKGGVTLHRSLDRETDDGAVGVAKIMGTDQGDPSLTSTATLTITVTDVNDCPPRLLPPDVLHVTEGEPPVLLGVLTATDDDVWALGHGPPFNLSLSSSNPQHIFELIDLKFDQHVDSGRGGAELWTRGSLDRETYRHLPVQVIIGDAGGLMRTQTVNIIVNDLNDNPMKPASKTVYLWKTQGSGSDAPLGRVYVDDPDDWDVADKTFRWAGKPHPLFTLNAKDGAIFASSQVREGRYELQFSVSDEVWAQMGVSANVTVVVRTLTHEAITHAAPIILTPTTPADLTRGWTPTSGGGVLGKLLESVQKVVGTGSLSQIEVVSVYGNYVPPSPSSSTSFVTHASSPNNPPSPTSTNDHHEPPHSRHPNGYWTVSPSSPIKHPKPSASCVWVSVKDNKDNFMDPIKLQGLLSLHSERLEKATGLSVFLMDPPSVFGKNGISVVQDPKTFESDTDSQLEEPEDSALSTLKLSHEEGGASVASLASTALPLQVVDTNITSLVTPLLIRTHECPSQENSRNHHSYTYHSDSCTPATCLNGGKCVRFPSGNRCVCPGGTWGPQCKILSRSFSGSGWGWVKPLPPCFPATISLQVLTRGSHGLLLYSGPLVPHSAFPESPNDALPTPMMALQVVDKFPQLIVEGVAGNSIRLQIDTEVSDGEWHTIHLHLNTQGVTMVMDLCGLGWENKPSDDSHCVARASWGNGNGIRPWTSMGPLQLGGLAQSAPRPEDYGWSEAPTTHPLNGCLSHLTINGQVVDLGGPAYSKGSAAGCRLQEGACSGDLGTCGIRGKCVGGLVQPECQCESGWTGPKCGTPTVPATLGSRSYLKLALSFTPPSTVITVQVRVRTLGSRTGMLLHLAAQHTQHSFTIHLRAGVACASVSGAGWAARIACVEGRPIGDGQWHTIKAERHGHNLLVNVDGGDEWRHNHSLPSLTAARLGLLEEEITGPPMPLEIDKHDGVTVGGLPEFLGVKLVAVHEDLQETCVDDLRVSGRQLPLPPAVNGSNWGQVTTLDGLTQGCNAPSNCFNTTCEPPLACHPVWAQPSCSCGPGRQLLSHTCQDVDECILRPCLHGGSCYNLKPGYVCVCGPNHIGDHCEWSKVTTAAHPLTAPAAIAAVTLSLLFIVVLGVFLSVRHHRLRTARALGGRQESEENGDKDSIIAVKTGSKGSVMALDPEKKETILGLKSGWKEAAAAKTKGPEDESHTTFLELLKLSRAKPARDAKGTGATSSGVSVAVITTTGVSRAKGVTGVVPLDQKHHHHLPGEDLRNYAYEGDGSSSGSLTSTISGLRAELEREESSSKVIAAEFVEVMDLLKNLPEAPKSSVLLARLKEKRSLVKDVRDPEIKRSQESLVGSLRRRGDPKRCDITKTPSPSPSAGSSSSSAFLSKEIKTIEMPSSKGRTTVYGKDELTTAC